MDKITTYRESSAALEEQIKTLQVENSSLKAECESLKSRPCWHSDWHSDQKSSAAAAVAAVLIVTVIVFAAVGFIVITLLAVR